MQQAIDEQALMPGAEVLTGLSEEIGRYNETRPAEAGALFGRQMLFMGTYAVVVLFVIYLVLQNGAPEALQWVLVGTAMSGWFIWDFALKPAREFQQTLRDRMLPMIFGFVERVRYYHGSAPGFMTSMPGNELVRRTRNVHRDTIAGRYEGLDFTMTETELSTGSGKSKETTFLGVIFHFRHETGFPGLLIATKKPNAVSLFFRDFFDSSGLQTVTSGIISVDEQHEFRTNNPQAATPIVQGALAKALDYLASVWPDGIVRIAMKNQDCYLLVPSKKDFFELPGIRTPIDFDIHVRPMIRDLVTLLATARLVERIGAGGPEAGGETGAGGETADGPVRDGAQT